MDFDVFLYRDESGAVIARVPAFVGCHSWGRTEAEALANVEDAIRLVVQDEAPVLERVGVRVVHVEA